MFHRYERLRFERTKRKTNEDDRRKMKGIEIKKQFFWHIQSIEGARSSGSD
jgi:hypothetical protein